ncbi:hypothetical protein ES703_114696 [subsurface metagenome]
MQSTDKPSHLGRPILINILIGSLCLLCPVPGIRKGFYLGFRLHAALFLEKYVVVLLAVERRVKVDEVNTFVRKVFTVS